MLGWEKMSVHCQAPDLAVGPQVAPVSSLGCSVCLPGWPWSL